MQTSDKVDVCVVVVAVVVVVVVVVVDVAQPFSYAGFNSVSQTDCDELNSSVQIKHCLCCYQASTSTRSQRNYAHGLGSNPLSCELPTGKVRPLSLWSQLRVVDVSQSRLFVPVLYPLGRRWLLDVSSRHQAD